MLRLECRKGLHYLVAETLSNKPLADDAVIWLSENNFLSAISSVIINNELSDTAKYMDMNKLDLNFEKN